MIERERERQKERERERKEDVSREGGKGKENRERERGRERGNNSEKVRIREQEGGKLTTTRLKQHTHSKEAFKRGSKQDSPKLPPFNHVVMPEKPVTAP